MSEELMNLVSNLDKAYCVYYNASEGSMLDDFTVNLIQALYYVYQLPKSEVDDALAEDRLVTLIPDNLLVSIDDYEDKYRTFCNLMDIVKQENCPEPMQAISSSDDNLMEFEGLMDGMEGAVLGEDDFDLQFNGLLDEQPIIEEPVIVPQLPPTPQQVQHTGDIPQFPTTQPVEEENLDISKHMLQNGSTNPTLQQPKPKATSDKFKQIQDNLIKFKEKSPSVLKNAITYCVEVAVKPQKNGQFLNCKFKDTNGKTFTGRQFNTKLTVEEAKKLVGKIVLIDGSWDNYQSYDYVNIDMIGPLKEESCANFDLSVDLFNPSSVSDAKELASKVLQIIQDMQDSDIKKLLKYVLIEKDFITKYSKYPGGVTYHHACKGGLLEHVVEVAEISIGLCDYYVSKGVNKDLVIAGALLHDIGKTFELPSDGTMNYTHVGNALGHIIIGTSLITRYALECRISDKILNNILHLIATHHGDREKGSPVPYNSIESCILHQADMISGEVNHIHTLVSDLSDSTGSVRDHGKSLIKIN